MKLPAAVHMKIKSHWSKKGKQLFLLLSLIAMAGTICAGEVKSAIITTTQLEINVPDNRILHIKNFTQEGGVERGVVMVTINGQMTSVLSAVIIDNTTAAPEIINQVTIAGPATVTVPAIAGATLLITYRKEVQPDSAGSSATPTPTPTP